MRESRTTILYGIAQLSIGGAERQLYELARHVDRDRYRPLVFTTSEGGVYADLLREAGVTLYVFPRRSAYDMRPIWQIAQLLRRERVQILHTFGYYAGLYGRLATWLYRPQLVISSERTQGGWAKYQRPPYSTFDRLLSQRTDCITANAQSVKEYVVSKKKIPREKVQVIYNGISQNPILSKVSQILMLNYKERHGFDSNVLIVGIVARLELVKDHKTFLEAASIILKVVRNVRFVVIGDGSLRTHLEDLSKQLDIFENVIFTGSITGEELVNMVSILDVVVLSSINEGCSNAILEAMVLGKPVVATEVGGNPELVANASSGFIVPPENSEMLATAVINLLKDAHLRNKMGVAAQKRVENLFSIERMVKNTESLYERVKSQPTLRSS